MPTSNSTPKRYFTKSAFRVALECPNRLYYYNNPNYANVAENDDFIQALADGGKQIGELAKIYEKVEEDLSGCVDNKKALSRTKELMECDKIVIAEAAFLWNNCFARADILRKVGNRIELIEVKSKSWDSQSTDKKKNPMMLRDTDSLSRSYEYTMPLYDIAFQKYVIQNALGDNYKITAQLMMVDKSVVVDLDGMDRMFEIMEVDGVTSVRRENEEQLFNNKHILTKANVDAICICDRIIRGETREQGNNNGWMLNMTFKDFVNTIADVYCNYDQTAPRDWTSASSLNDVSRACFKCPYLANSQDVERNDGYKECWRHMAGFSDTDFDIPLVKDFSGADNQWRVQDRLISHNIYKIIDVDPADLNRIGNADSLNTASRWKLQAYAATYNNEFLVEFGDRTREYEESMVYLDADGIRRYLSEEQLGHPLYPIHMIDFETTQPTVPYYERTRPNEYIAFLFSHHIIEKDGTIRHAGQYFNSDIMKNPNFEFVRELKKQLTDAEGNVTGTIFRYSTHENTILCNIKAQLNASEEKDKDKLISFVDEITHEGIRTGDHDMVDLEDIVKKFFFLPDMKGRTSIKVVLPAVLNNSSDLQDKYSKPIYGKEKKISSLNVDEETWITLDNGKVQDPYHRLPSIGELIGLNGEQVKRIDEMEKESEGGFENMVINNGALAMIAYHVMMHTTSEKAKKIKEALLRYCELDSMAMVFIWEYFRSEIGI